MAALPRSPSVDRFFGLVFPKRRSLRMKRQRGSRYGAQRLYAMFVRANERAIAHLPIRLSRVMFALAVPTDYTP
jgi:hypothetical protein